MNGPLDEILGAFDATRPLAQASTIPGSWYTDPRVHDLEAQTVFARSWHWAARLDQLTAPGSFVTTEIGGEPIVVVRGTDGVLRAFFNVCRHHAAAVCTAPAGRAERLRCPYHGWTYSLEGELKSTPEFEGVACFDPKENGLVPLAVATWEKFVFVRIAPEGESLEAFLGDRLRGDFTKLGLAELHYAGSREYLLGCNWKVFVDNYLDGGYHVPYLHRGLNSVISYKEYAIDTFDRVCLQSSPIASSNANVVGGNPDIQAVSKVRRGHARYYWLYPNLMLNWYEGYLDTNLVIPLGLDRTKVVFDFYFADVTEAARRDNEESMAVCDRIQDEDHAICESVQRGLRSRAYGAGRLSVRREAGENLFHKLLAANLRDGKRRLAVAPSTPSTPR